MPQPGQSVSQAKHIATERRKKMWRLRQQGMTLETIAVQLGVTASAVSRSLAKVDARANEKLATIRMSQKHAQLSQLLWQYEEYCKAWEKSKEDYQRATRKSTAEGATDVLEGYERSGDPRYLAEARQCLRDIRSLLGLDIMASAQDSDVTLIDLLNRLGLPYVGHGSETQKDQPGNQPDAVGTTPAGDGGV
jgi:predicted transcriptional regulator